MTIKELVESAAPDYLDVIELEEDNIYKSNMSIPYSPTPEFEELLEYLVENKESLGGLSSHLKIFLGKELSGVQSEREMHTFECSEHFDDRERKIKNWMSRIF